MQLSALGFKKQLAFALLVLERMLPDLIAFSRDTGFDVSPYLRGRDSVWGALQDKPIDQTVSRSCIQSVPDTEKYSHALTSYALNAALATNEILELVSDHQTDHLGNLLTLARESIYLYVSGLEPSIISSTEDDERIDSHFLMQQEKRQEEDDINLLSKLPDELDNEEILALRARAKTSPPLLLRTN